jgi:hypothetical protein
VWGCWVFFFLQDYRNIHDEDKEQEIHKKNIMKNRMLKTGRA